MRAGDLSKSAYGVASRALRRDWDRLAVVDFREVEAGRLAAKYGLRGFDAIHLSSAMTIASAPAGPDVLFSSFDAALNRAAAGERLQVLSPNERLEPSSHGSHSALAGVLLTVNCPYCKIPSMGAVASGKVEVDRCRTCGAAWFDPGEIRELTQGRLPAEEDAGPAADPSPPAKEEKGAALRLAWGEARGLPCPRCGEPLRPTDFQLTGVPVFRCGGCGGMLVSRRGVKFCRAIQIPARPRPAV